MKKNANRKKISVLLFFLYRHLNTINIFSYQEVTKKKNYKTLSKVHLSENTQ